MRIGSLYVHIWNNFDAEDDLSNSLEDVGLLSDLIITPIKEAISEYLLEDYGRYLDIDVEIIR